MTTNHIKSLNVALLILIGSATCAYAQTVATPQQTIAPAPQVTYHWQSMPVVGGGCVPGIICHPNVEGLRYCRTDMGGAYRYDSNSKAWVQLLDWLSEDESNLQGVESIALDPQHAERVYLACGTYTGKQGSILRSEDYGRSFQRIDVPIRMGGNENGRGNGERMMVDPQNPDVIFFGTRLDGLWHSTDAGHSWQRVASFPDISEAPDPDNRNRGNGNRGAGIITLVFAPDTKLDAGKPSTQTIYAACSLRGRESIFVTTDGGMTWSTVANQPTALRPTHMVLSGDGCLYISYADTPGPSAMTDGAVWKYNTRKGKWQDITPMRLGPDGKAGFGYAAVCVDKRNPKHVLATTHYLHGQGGNNSEELFRSLNGGKTWTAVYKHGCTDDNTLAPYTAVAPLHWMFDIEIDPFNSDHVLFTTGFGGWETYNLSAATEKGEKVLWQIMSTGIEETVPLELYCPPAGAHLLTGVGDYGGFTYYDVQNAKPQDANHMPYFGNTDGVCGAWHKPQMMLRCGYIFNHLTHDAPIAYSFDGGRNWQPCSHVPGDIPQGEKGEPDHGHVAMSADGTTWVWTPERKPAFYTTDNGETWTECQGLPRNIKVIADKEDDRLFYAVDVRRQTLYVSTDGAHSFAACKLVLNTMQQAAAARRGQQSDGHHAQDRGDTRGGQDRVYAIPGHSGQLWLAAYDGLYFIDITSALTAGSLSDIIITPEQMSHVRQMTAFGIGKAADGNDYPTLFMIGTADGQYGIFRSTDNARSWLRINDDAHQYGKLLHIAGDMQDFGRVYIGTHGRCTIMGAPAD